MSLCGWDTCGPSKELTGLLIETHCVLWEVRILFIVSAGYLSLLSLSVALLLVLLSKPLQRALATPPRVPPGQPHGSFPSSSSRVHCPRRSPSHLGAVPLIIFINFTNMCWSSTRGSIPRLTDWPSLVMWLWLWLVFRGVVLRISELSVKKDWSLNYWPNYKVRN